MAFCSLPCWTNFSAALSTFCLLKPKPNAIRMGTPDRASAPVLGFTGVQGCLFHRPKTSFGDGPSDKVDCTAGQSESVGYYGLSKGSVQTGQAGCLFNTVR